MKVYKKKKKHKAIHVNLLADGQVATITSWTNGNKSYVGRVVQRHEDLLIVLGEDADHSWSNLFNKNAVSYGCFVKILKPGTKLVV